MNEDLMTLLDQAAENIEGIRMQAVRDIDLSELQAEAAALDSASATVLDRARRHVKAAQPGVSSSTERSVATTKADADRGHVPGADARPSGEQRPDPRVLTTRSEEQ